jgi:UDP-N-acetylmuramoyl-L-alanyl-D-glutamate--2,6-diaminopimelate ligase
MTADSRAVAPGFLFAALPGAQRNGLEFVPEALRRGAVAVLADRAAKVDLEGDRAVLLSDPNPRRRFALMAARFHARQPRIAVAVTGTNGKSSTVEFTRQIWATLGRKSASLGTLGLISSEGNKPGSLTTPDPVVLHATLSDLDRRGIECVAFEASSHGLAQYRLDGVRLAAAAFTNLTRDHLDYHGSMEAYFAAKQRLFSEVMPAGGGAVLNADIAEYETLKQIAANRGHRLFSFGWRGVTIQIDEIKPVSFGLRLRFRVSDRAHAIDLPLVGSFQASNAICALGLALATGMVEADAIKALQMLRPVRGRLERVGARANGAEVFVDYAHTPDALSKVLTALRPHCKGKLVAIFGCGGDRDPGKRPEMGKIAVRLSDRAILTDDNPRSEDPALIRRAVLAAAPAAREIADRGKAIATAIHELEAGDILAICGKGHESGQIVGNKILPFDDAEVARAALREAK